MDGEKLTKPQMARLVEIGMAKVAWADHSPKRTAALAELGVVEIRWPTATKMFRPVRLTPLGTRILASLPGDEFDRFRAALAEQEKAHA